MDDTVINDAHDRISKILKNDHHYTYKEMGEFIVTYANTLPNIESLYTEYPALLDIIELGAAIEHGTSVYQEHIRQQAQYKLSELKKSLPDIR